MSRPKFTNIGFETVIERLKKCLGLQTDAQIAEKIDLTKSAFSERKRRNSIPVSEIELLCEKESINIDYLITGEGEMFKSASPALSAREEQKKFYLSVNQYIAEHNSQIIERWMGQLSRIINEGDYRKTSAIQSLLDVLDPKQDKTGA